MARVQKSPDAFRTISEVARWLETPAHVLRFWESRFKQIAPVKRAGGRRYYRPEDMQLLGGIKHLLHDEGRTIKSVQELMDAEGTSAVSKFSQALPSADETESKGEPKEAEVASTEPASHEVAEAAVEVPEASAEKPPEDHTGEPVDAAPAASPEPDLADADSTDEDAGTDTPPPARTPRKPRHGFMLGYPPPDAAPEPAAAAETEPQTRSLPPLPDMPPDPDDLALPGALPSVAALLRGLEPESAAASADAAMLAQVASRLEALRGARP